MWRFAVGVISGIWIAQTYSLPNISDEFKKFEKEYLKKK